MFLEISASQRLDTLQNTLRLEGTHSKLDRITSGKDIPETKILSLSFVYFLLLATYNQSNVYYQLFIKYLNYNLNLSNIKCCQNNQLKQKKFSAILRHASLWFSFIFKLSHFEYHQNCYKSNYFP